MAIPSSHFRHYEDVFRLTGFIQEPMLIFGYQEIRERDGADLGPLRDVPDHFRCADLSECLVKMGCADVKVLDQYDSRADLRFDMNEPIPQSEHEGYGAFIDVGCLEHVFDTRQCVENYLRLVRQGGHLLIHTCVNGYFAHGLHVFNPQAIIDALRLNGFEIRLVRFTDPDGQILDTPAGQRDVLMWLVGRKTRMTNAFTPPVQYWEDFFRQKDRQGQVRTQRAYWKRIENIRSDVAE